MDDAGNKAALSNIIFDTFQRKSSSNLSLISE